MTKIVKYVLQSLIVFSVVLLVWDSYATTTINEDYYIPQLPPDSINAEDTTDLRFEFADEDGMHFEQEVSSPLFMQDPPNIKTEVVYDPETNEYVFQDKAGTLNYRRPMSLTFQQYQEQEMQGALQQYWLERAKASSIRNTDGTSAQIEIGGEAFEQIFGGNTIDIRPQGTAKVDFGIVSNKRDDPSLDVRQRRTTNFNFDEEIAMNVMAKIGDKIEFNVNYNTEATFDFENKLKLKYEGKEDEILQLIEAGDVTLPLNSTLINGSQSLFGVKTQMKFGNATVTTVFSKQKSESKTITVEDGAQTSTFEIGIDEYESNKHFFLDHYFRETYNDALEDLPLVKSSIEITKIEVWRTTIGAATDDNRNIVALADLGETRRFNNDNIMATAGASFPKNDANNLLYELDVDLLREISSVSDYIESQPEQFVSGEDYEKVENATLLDESQYSVNSQLGFISLNTTITSDQVLAVAYQYKIIGSETVYQVGEFSDEGISSPDALVVKLLKSTSVNTYIPMWDLMMKNVYSIGAYQVNEEDFTLNILYSGGESGVATGYLSEGPDDVNGVPLIRVLNVDNLDQQDNPPYDGIFDFIDGAATDGGTIQASNGKIYFPVVEPFGDYLREQLGSDELGDQYAYDSLYSMTKVGAQQYPSQNKFTLEGMYKSSSSNEISLNALNVPQGSVKVTAGGIELTENVDYTVDYTLGRVRILNEGILNSGTPVNISLESNSMFNIMQQTMAGMHVDYRIQDNFNVGATLLNLSERPLTQKTNYGDDPISNTMWGLNFDYETESRLLTKLVDKLPFIETKEKSNIQFNGEFAQLIPGHSSAIGDDGASYIADFEGSKSTIDLRTVGNWYLASTPQGQTDAGMFPEAATGTGLKYGFNRARTAWYIIDQTVFYESTGTYRPNNVDNDEISSHYTRYVSEKEVFPNVDLQQGQSTSLSIFNVAFYPEERGPYNFDTDGDGGYSSGIDADGNLIDPDTRWGGLMRQMDGTDFEASNVEYIEFWMMDPFADPDGDGEKEPINTKGGQLYFNLGDISEDILRDRRKSYEHGLPTSETVEDVDTTIWGRVPNIQAMVNEFDNDEDARPYQDVGYDGLMNDDEISFFATSYLEKIATLHGTGSQAYLNAIEDVSADDYHYFRGSDYDDDATYSSVLERYKLYNGVDGNSPTDAMNEESYTTIATGNPNLEDINEDNTLSESERYYQYVVDLDPNNMVVGENYITDAYTASDITLANGETGEVTWYQFKIPVKSPDKVVGSIQDFNSIRFMRMFLKGFEEPVVLRFATLELVRGDWRQYELALLDDGEYIVQEDESSFDISAVNIEENGSRDPIPYVLPPGVEREQTVGTTTVVQDNEQSMVLEVCDLEDGFARAAYKTTDFDFRQYENLMMYVHAEQTNYEDSYQTGDLTVFIRLGSDFNDNYYEYEVPLEFTEWYTSDRSTVWPDNNEIDIELEDLTDAKLQRTEAQNNGTTNITNSMEYVVYDGANKITIKGVPSLSDIETIMIGVRNPKKSSFDDDDDGLAKCAEIWVNELRVSGFDENSGWAATATMRANLADLGTMTIAGSHSSAGFGAISESVNERQQESVTQVDFSTNLELGKFFPKESGIKIPMHFDYSESKSTPEYDPMNPDILLSEVTKNMTKKEKDSVMRRSEDLTVRKNINFMNVRKDRVGGGSSKPKVWDIENFNFSYAYSETFSRSIDVQYDRSKEYMGGIGYNFVTTAKSVTPFKKVSLFQGDWLKLLREFNFNYVPNMFTFRTEMNREYTERLLRSKSTGDIILEPTYSKDWDWTRNYSLQYNLTKSIKLDYSASVSAYIDEPSGVIDKDSDDYAAMRDTILDEIFSFGTMDRYYQTFNATYKVPINQIPLFDWASIQTSYKANYTWQASAQSIQETMGNSIENSNNIQLNGNFRLSKLYEKVDYIKQLNRSNSRSRRGGPPSRSSSRGGDSRQQQEAEKDSTKKSSKIFKGILDNTLRLVTMVKDASVTYNETNGTLLPGFTPEPDMLGNRWSDMSPGLGFVFGSQDDIRYRAARNGWITADTLMNNQYMTKQNTAFSYRIKIEPYEDFKIELTGNQTESTNYAEYFKADSDGIFGSFNPVESGSFSTTIITWKTAFESFNVDNISEAFDNLKDNRQTIASRLGDENPWSDGVVDSTGFADGYSASSQQVLIPAFLAAYTGSDPGGQSLSPFTKIPLPNWRVSFDGLTNIPAVKKLFKSVSISHSYRSMYTVSGYTTNAYYEEDAGYSVARDAADNFYAEKEIGTVTISEQLSPLVGVDATLHNSLMASFELKRSRNLALSFTNNQLTEVKSKEIVIGAGYRIKDIEFFVKSATTKNNTKKSRQSSDMNIKIDLSIKDTKTILRRIDEDYDQISAGRKSFTLNGSADYSVSQRFNLRFYYNQNINEPHISTQYPTSNSEGGISMTFTLQ